MSGFMRGMRLGAGLVAFGYGISRLRSGQRDWSTTAAMTTGASMLLSGISEGVARGRSGPALGLLGAATEAAESILAIE